LCYNKIKIFKEALKMDFSITSKFSENPKCWLINISGEVDIFNSAEMKTKLIELIEQNPVDIRIECKNLTYIDSTGLGALIAVLKKTKEYNRSIYLQNLKSSLSKLFKITNLDKVFIIEGDSKEGDSNE